ncbi:hypothetical protein NFI96_011938, partial [Prochilodus magdalenae]
MQLSMSTGLGLP